MLIAWEKELFIEFFVFFFGVRRKYKIIAMAMGTETTIVECYII